MAKKKISQKIKPRDLIILTLQSGMASEFWGIMLQIAQVNIDKLTEQIIDKVDYATKTEFSDAEVDRLRDKRGYLIELMKTPEKYIERLMTQNIEPESFDPYYTDPKQIIADRRKRELGL